MRRDTDPAGLGAKTGLSERVLRDFAATHANGFAGRALRNNQRGLSVLSGLSPPDHPQQGWFHLLTRPDARFVLCRAPKNSRKSRREYFALQLRGPSVWGVFASHCQVDGRQFSAKVAMRLGWPCPLCKTHGLASRTKDERLIRINDLLGAPGSYEFGYYEFIGLNVLCERCEPTAMRAYMRARHSPLDTSDAFAIEIVRCAANERAKQFGLRRAA